MLPFAPKKARVLSRREGRLRGAGARFGKPLVHLLRGEKATGGGPEVCDRRNFRYGVRVTFYPVVAKSQARFSAQRNWHGAWVTLYSVFAKSQPGLSRQRNWHRVSVTLYPVFAKITLVGAGTLSVPAQGKVLPTPIPFFAGISMLPGQNKPGASNANKNQRLFCNGSAPPTSHFSTQH